MRFDARKFSKESYNENDSIAKEIFLKYLSSRGFDDINMEETGNHDVIARKNGAVYYYELEMTVFDFTSIESYDHSYVKFLGRKRRLHKKHPFIYVIISKNRKYAITAFSTDIFKWKNRVIVDINTKHRKGLDEFFMVKKEECKVISLEDE